MRMWTKSACVVLVLGVLLIPLAVGLNGSDRQAQANTRIAGRTHATLTAAVNAAATTVTVKSRATYVVQDGDTLSGIAARFAVPGGWPALYAANQARLGLDPNAIWPGSVLILPGKTVRVRKTVPVRYSVKPGDTLSGIATALAVPGGWPALYAANRRAIGANPSVIQPGTVIMVPRQVASAATPGGPPRRPVQRRMTRPGTSVHPAQPPARTATRHAHVPVAAKRPAAAGMPSWLVVMLLGAGFLIGAAFLAEPVVVLASRRRSVARQRRATASTGLQGLGFACRAARKPRIVIADYDRLVVIQCNGDDTVYVLRPRGEDPTAILRVARLVLRERPYRELADHLDLSAGTQTGRPADGDPNRRPVFPSGSDGFGLQGPPQSLGLRDPGEGWDQDLLRRDSTRAAT